MATKIEMQKVKQELEQIRLEGGGFLNPHKVVEFASDPETALHGQFEWDDTEAAHKYRLAQARAIIRVAVVVSPSSSGSVQAYVSLTDDRYSKQGYRAIVEVVNDEVLREKLLQDALKELNTFKRKYERLKDVSALRGVLVEIDALMPEEEAKSA